MGQDPPMGTFRKSTLRATRFQPLQKPFQTCHLTTSGSSATTYATQRIPAGTPKNLHHHLHGFFGNSRKNLLPTETAKKPHSRNPRSHPPHLVPSTRKPPTKLTARRTHATLQPKSGYKPATYSPAHLVSRKPPRNLPNNLAPIPTHPETAAPHAPHSHLHPVLRRKLPKAPAANDPYSPAAHPPHSRVPQAVAPTTMSLPAPPPHSHPPPTRPRATSRIISARPYLRLLSAAFSTTPTVSNPHPPALLHTGPHWLDKPLHQNGPLPDPH
ncbi:hypothetical protein C8J57DRAFT_1256521 [Mycena rebaudengoi]|nr:hypothetical protein C8J57DRAFT_1256521 [Mycena rebaudengoi]